MAYSIPLSSPVFEGNEKDYLQDAISCGQLATNGEFINKFESGLLAQSKTHYAVGLNSGTSALHLALILLGVGRGDEVICQSFTFCASANPIVYLGGTPIFVDSEEDTWNISPDLLEEAILDRLALGRKPKAIVVVHLFGMPAKMKEIMEISEKYDIPVIEDAAEAVGSTHDGKSCGTLGTLGFFSFNGNKIITTGGGGALLTNDPRIVQKAKYLSTQAKENLPYYQHLEIGYNYRMNNMAAAIGLAQLEKLDGFVAKRRLINAGYRSLFGQIQGIHFQPELPESKSNFWLSTILIDESIGVTNEDYRTMLLESAIETRYLWKPLHLQPIFNNAPYYGGQVAEGLFSRGLCLPSSTSLTLEDQERIMGVLEKQLSKV
jgi:dTDP-4-amino-4,6-dideoxygalactose transaminase